MAPEDSFKVLDGQRESGVSYDPDARFEVVVLLYLKKGKRHDIHDVDNRLKDILDALQARFGGPKSVRRKSRLFQNDRQVSRVVWKAADPKGSLRGRWWALTYPALRAAPMATAANEGRPVPKTLQETGRAVTSCVVGMARWVYDLQLTRYRKEGWRATFYPRTGRERRR